MDSAIALLFEQMNRIEGKLDVLISALAQDDDEGPTHDLDGNELPGERDQSQTL
jgi:hypothetical protein